MATANVRVIGHWEDSDATPAAGTVYFQRHDTIQEYGSTIVFGQIERTRLDADGNIDTEVVGADPDDPNPLTRFYRVTERIVTNRAAVVYDIELDAESGTVDLTTVDRVEALPSGLTIYATSAALTAESQARAAADVTLQAAIDAIELSGGVYDDTEVRGLITSEAAARAVGDSDLADDLTSEAAVRAAGDVGLADDIAAEAAARSAGDSDLADSVVVKVDKTLLLNGVNLTVDRTLPNLDWSPHCIPAGLAVESSDAPVTVSFNSSRVFGQYIDYANSTTPNHFLTWSLLLDEGVWKLIGWGDLLATNGISAITLNGVFLANWNQWAPATSVNAKWEQSGIVIPSTGRYILRAANVAAGGGSSTSGGRFSAWKAMRST